MKFAARFLRFISPSFEDERQEFRRAAAKSEAFSEEMHRSLSKHHDDITETLRKAFCKDKDEK